MENEFIILPDVKTIPSLVPPKASQMVFLETMHP